MPTIGAPYNPDLITFIEQQMEKSSNSYFDTTLNFIKWNTAIVVAATLWFANYFINTTTKLNLCQEIFAIISLIFFVGAMGCSIWIFYSISKYFNKHWVLCSQWRESVITNSLNPPQDRQIQQNEVIKDLLDHYQNLPKKAKKFDNAILLQMVILYLGLGSFVVFIILIKLLP